MEEQARVEAEARTVSHVEAQIKLLTEKMRALGFSVTLPVTAEYTLDDLQAEVDRFVAAGGVQPSPLDLYYHGLGKNRAATKRERHIKIQDDL